MLNEYPEHIDQLDHFYQQNLAELEILPPSDMWDRISAAYDEGSKDRKKAVPFFNNNKKVIGVVLVALFISTSTYFYVSNSNNQNEEENTIPAINNELKTDSSSIDITNREINSQRSPNIKQRNSKSLNETTNSGDSKSNASSTVEYTDKTTESSEEMIVSEPEIEIQKDEPKEEVVEKAPKKKVSFKDKYKKDYQDSTRKLFVPGK